MKEIVKTLIQHSDREGMLFIFNALKKFKIFNVISLQYYERILLMQ